MKILVDQAKLMKAFDIVTECRNNLPGDGWVKEQLQIACNIIGPMWANGVDENKILVNKGIIEEAFHKVSWMANQKFPYKPGDGSDFNDVYRILQKILIDNHDPTKGKCLVCGRETNKTMSALDINYCGTCWNSGRAEEHKKKEKEKPLTPITPEELMEIVRIGQEIYGKKNTEENIEAEINEQLANYNMFNPTEKHDDSQIPTRSKEKNIQAIKDAIAGDQRPVEFNPPCAEYCIPEVEKIMEREVSNHRAIIEILDIMMDSNCSRGWNRSTIIETRLKALKNKMVGEK
jgi:hypothetical protein